MYKKAHAAIRANPLHEKKPKKDVKKKRSVPHRTFVQLFIYSTISGPSFVNVLQVQNLQCFPPPCVYYIEPMNNSSQIWGCGADVHFSLLMCRMLMALIVPPAPLQVEPRQVISGTEEGPRRPEKGQLPTGTRTRGRGRIDHGPPCLYGLLTQQINLLQTRAASCRHIE